ncbi:hypothetical protein ACWCSH_48115, partial [Streptosporangium sp. NPDC001682]
EDVAAVTSTQIRAWKYGYRDFLPEGPLEQMTGPCGATSWEADEDPRMRSPGSVLDCAVTEWRDGGDEAGCDLRGRFLSVPNPAGATSRTRSGPPARSIPARLDSPTVGASMLMA